MAHRWENTECVRRPHWVYRAREKDSQAQTADLRGLGRAAGTSEQTEIKAQTRERRQEVLEVSRGKKLKGRQGRRGSNNRTPSWRRGWARPGLGEARENPA